MNNIDLVPKPRFVGLFIPSEILEIEELTSTDCMLLAWIDALQSKEHGGCFASNDYFAKKLKLKENTIKILISKLVDLKLVERVSFDGRQRILRVCKENWFRKSESTSDVDLNQPQGLNKINPCGGLESTPHIYRDISLEKSIDNNKGAANAADEKFNPSSSKEKKSETPEVSENIKTLTLEMISELKEALPDWIPPKSPKPLLHEVAAMVEIEKREPKRILAVFRWAIADPFWLPKFAKPNPMKYLRAQFGQLAANLDAKPKPKERKFAPCSDQALAKQYMQELDARAL